MSEKQSQPIQLDDLLDEALDGFEEVEEERVEHQPTEASQPGSSLNFNPLPPRKSKKPGGQGLGLGLGLGQGLGQGQGQGQGLPNLDGIEDKLGDDQEVNQMLGQITDALQQIFKDMDKGQNSQKPDMDATVAALAEETSTLRKGDGPSPLDPDNPPPFMQDLVKEIMKHIVAKEVLYEPMREIGLRYPAWLEENKSVLSPEDLKKYQTQQLLISDIVEVYENDEKNYDKLMVILEQMHSLGSPPQAIVEAVAPGVSTEGLDMLSDPNLFPGK